MREKCWAMSAVMPLLLSAMAGMAQASYVQTVEVYEYAYGEAVDWQHTYDFSEVPPYDLVTLSIVADDVDGPGEGLEGEHDAVYVNGAFVGYLATLQGYTDYGYSPGPGGALTTSVFQVDSVLLDWSIPLAVRIETFWGTEIETSTLTVQGSGTPVPAPASLSLILTATGLLGLLNRARKK